MFKKIIVLIFFCSLNTSTYSLETYEKYLVSDYENCADQKFTSEFYPKYDYYVSMTLPSKIKLNRYYEWFFEDCEKEASNSPIKFKVRNTIYKDDVDEITRRLFETCGDYRYLQENGDTYSEFLKKPLNIKMIEEIEYDWMIEACEKEYQTYPIKFILKYS